MLWGIFLLRAGSGNLYGCQPLGVIDVVGCHPDPALSPFDGFAEAGAEGKVLPGLLHDLNEEWAEMEAARHWRRGK